MISLLRSVLGFVLAVTLSISSASAQGFFDHPLIGKAAPDFILNTLNAKEVKFSDVSKGKDAIVFFWATWCPHCREQVKSLYEQKAKLDRQGIAIVLVDIGEDRAVVQKFVQSKKYDLDIFLDEKSYIAEMYEVYGVPTMFFIGKDGKVREMLNVFPDDYEQIFL